MVTLKTKNVQLLSKRHEYFKMRFKSLLLNIIRIKLTTSRATHVADAQ